MESQTFAQRLTRSLVKLQYIDTQEASSILKLFHERSKSRLDYFLLDEGIISKNNLLAALADMYEIESFDARGYLFQHDLVTLFPKDFLLSQVCIPSSLEDDVLTMVVSDPEHEDFLQLAGQYVSYIIVPQVGIARDIIDAIEEYYEESYTLEALHEEQEEEHDGVQDESDEVELL